MKKTQALKMLKMKNSVSQLKVSVESLTNRTDHFKNRKSGVLAEAEEWEHLAKHQGKVGKILLTP